MHIKCDTPKSLVSIPHITIVVYVNMFFELFSLYFDRTVERILESRDSASVGACLTK